MQVFALRVLLGLERSNPPARLCPFRRSSIAMRGVFPSLSLSKVRKAQLAAPQSRGAPWTGLRPRGGVSGISPVQPISHLPGPYQKTRVKPHPPKLLCNPFRISTKKLAPIVNNYGH